MNNEIYPAPSEFTVGQIGQQPILHFFHYTHLPPSLQKVSKQFFELARFIVENTERSAEQTASLRKLLEAKDCAVRAALPAPVISQRDHHTRPVTADVGDGKEGVVTGPDTSESRPDFGSCCG